MMKPSEYVQTESNKTSLPILNKLGLFGAILSRLRRLVVVVARIAELPLEIPLVFRTILSHRNLIYALTRRDLSDRYAGQLLSLFWVFAHPILTVLIYLFLFGFIVRTKTSINATGDYYTVYLLSGLLPWLGFVEGFSRWTTAITSKASLVKQVIFPVEVLPLVNVLLPLFTQSIMMGLFILYVSIGSDIYWGNIWLLPFALLIQATAMTGLSFFLSSTGVYFKDLKDLVQIFSSLGVYLAPVVYLPEMLPKSISKLIALNPFTHLIQCFRDAFTSGPPNVQSWGISTFLALTTLAVGHRVFRKTRPYFGSAL